MKEKILILGTSGFAGSVMAYYFTNRNYKVIGTYRTQKIKPHIFFLKNKNLKNFSTLKLDFSKNVTKFIKKIEKIKPQYIIDFASICMVNESWENPEIYINRNANNKSILIKNIAKFKFLKKYIYISSPEIFGQNNKKIDENYSRYNPSTPYATSKLTTEFLIKNYLKYNNSPFIICRFSNFYGPGQPIFRLIPKTIMCINKNIKFPLEGKGKSKRNFLFTEDFGSAIHLVMKKGKIGKIYHFSGNKFYKIKEIVKLICNLKKVNFDKLVKITKDRKGKDEIYNLNCTWTKKQLGWYDNTNIKEGLKKTIKFYDLMFKKLKNEPMTFKLK